jgi:ubiquinone/menaquinone biosynthesis C-methylase UbiE
MTYQSFDGHGVDVATKRADDVDKRTLTYIAEHPGCRVLDLGSGAGGQSVRMTVAGAQVVAIDRYDFAEQFAIYGHPTDKLRFIPGDMRQLLTLVPNQRFDIALCQRTIHYLPFNDALVFLRELRQVITDKLFISVTGTGSLVGEVYSAATVSIGERFVQLSELGQEMFSITEPVCLYSESEFRALLETAGWTIDECWVSAFGNIKAVCSK